MRWTNPGARGEHLTRQLTWVAARLLVTRVFPVYLVYELVIVFLVLLNEVKMLLRCKTSLAQGICYSQEYMLLQVKVVGFEKTVFPSHR